MSETARERADRLMTDYWWLAWELGNEGRTLNEFSDEEAQQIEEAEAAIRAAFEAEAEGDRLRRKVEGMLAAELSDAPQSFEEAMYRGGRLSVLRELLGKEADPDAE